VTKPGRWLTAGLDRLAEEVADLSDSFLVRWDRLTDGIAAGREKLADRFLARWHRLTDGIAAGREKLADRFLARWHRLTDGIAAGREKLADRFLARWHRIAAGREGLADRFLVRWYRLTDRIAVGRERLADGWSRRGVASRTAILVTVLSALLAVPVIALIRAGRDTPVPSSGTPATPAASPEIRAGRDTSAAEDQLPGFGVHVNEQAGYLFSYPDAWTLSHSGETTRLLSPKGDIVMTFGLAPSRALEPASDRVVAKVASSYSDVELVTGEVERTPQGQPSLVVGGRATDASGAAVRFLVITIRGTDQTRAITVRFAAGSDPLDSLPVIREIVASFRTSDTG